jgi:Leucine-rich repeat (LRR) protein
LELALRDGAPSKNTVLTDLGLKDLPQLPIGLLSLDISSNPLRTLPPELEDQALTLRSLTADDIGLRQLPEVVLQLRELRELRLRKNSLRDLPRLSSLSVLHTLDISMNAISVFPRAALELGTLKHLFMAFNKIERVRPLLFLGLPPSPPLLPTHTHTYTYTHILLYL